MSTVKWILLLAIPTLISAHRHHHHNHHHKKEIIKLPEFKSLNSIFYDLRTNRALKIETDSSGRLPKDPQSYVSRGIPCSCVNMTCGCCAGMIIEVLNLNRTACTNITMVPEEFALDFRLMVDEEEMFKNRITARNPPPACLPLYFFPIVNFCVRVFDIRLINSTFIACIDFETRVSQWPLFILHFDCIQVGQGEVSWVKPQSSQWFDVAGLEPPPPPIESAGEPYDEVNFEEADFNSTNYTSNMTSEEEDKIGTLKIR